MTIQETMVSEQECTRIRVEPFESEASSSRHINTTWMFKVTEESATERRVCGRFEFDDDAMKSLLYTNHNIVEMVFYKHQWSGRTILSFKEGFYHDVEHGYIQALVAGRYHSMDHFYTLNCDVRQTNSLLMIM
jgi:hypothetical protein